MKFITNDRPDTLHIEWVVSNHCNYSCSYCAPVLYGNTSGWPDLETSLKFWDYIHTEVNPNDKRITLSGGEPTMWPKIGEFFKRLDPSYERAIVTNGSRTIRWWTKFMNESPPDVITISTHLEFANIDHIVNVLKLINGRCRVSVLILMKHGLEEKGIEFAERIKQESCYCQIVLKAVQTRHYENDNSVPQYSDEITKLIGSYDYNNQSPEVKEQPQKLSAHLVIDGEHTKIFDSYNIIAKNEHQFLGWKCHIGTYRLIVWHDGQVYGAQCTTAKDIPLGNLNNGKLDIIPQPVTCKTKFCGCVPDIRIPKYDPKQYTPDSQWPNVPFEEPGSKK